jgi:hypothetical protein
MNRDFNPSKLNVRSVFACAAVLASLLVLSSIDSLSRHYGTEADIAAAHAVTLAANSGS